MSFVDFYQSVCVFRFEGGMWDLMVLIPGHCLSIYTEQDAMEKLIGMYQEKEQLWNISLKLYHDLHQTGNCL